MRVKGTVDWQMYWPVLNSSQTTLLAKLQEVEPVYRFKVPSSAAVTHSGFVPSRVKVMKFVTNEGEEATAILPSKQLIAVEPSVKVMIVASLCFSRLVKVS